MKLPIFTPLAEEDLRRITRESIEFFGTRQARVYLDRLTTATTALASGHRRGRPFDSEQPERLRFNEGAHVIIFRIRNDGRVLILRILHSRMNLSSHL